MSTRSFLKSVVTLNAGARVRLKFQRNSFGYDCNAYIYRRGWRGLGWYHWYTSAGTTCQVAEERCIRELQIRINLELTRADREKSLLVYKDRIAPYVDDGEPLGEKAWKSFFQSTQ